ncbi:MAG: aminopeptidase P N-terminal domain-containing protein [Gemmatimonadota bacterium]|jgi:Xaa-Pro aminopeptidase
MITQPEALPSSLREARLGRVAERLGPHDVMVLAGAPARVRSRDTEYPYRPDSELYWLTGLLEPEAVAVLRGGEEGALVLFLRSRDPSAELWTGTRPDPEALGREVGAKAVHPVEDLGSHLPKLLEGTDTVHFRLGEHLRLEAFVLEALRTARRRGARTGTGPSGVRDPGVILDPLRLRKEPWEVEQIRRAAHITLAGFEALEAVLAPGVPEWELQAALEGTFRRLGGGGPAYETIVGSGSNACTLHYVRNDRVPGEGEMVLVDAGATWGLYAADVTRTYPLGGRYTPRQKELVSLVERARSEAVGQVAPGVTVAEIHETAVGVLVEGLRELGLLQGSVDELLETDAHAPFFPHRTSHWLGLDVHDPGDYARDGASTALEAGMVLTVEPGLYVGPAALEAAGAAAEPWQGLGVRLEDDVVVTEEGHENLTRALPAAPGRVEERLAARG